MPAKISTAPTLSRGVSVSPSISQEKNEPNTGSPENMRAARVAEVYLWAKLYQHGDRRSQDATMDSAPSLPWITSGRSKAWLPQRSYTDDHHLDSGENYRIVVFGVHANKQDVSGISTALRKTSRSPVNPERQGQRHKS